jgi:hypothetical protein
MATLHAVSSVEAPLLMPAVTCCQYQIIPSTQTEESGEHGVLGAANELH